MLPRDAFLSPPRAHSGSADSSLQLTTLLTGRGLTESSRPQPPAWAPQKLLPASHQQAGAPSLWHCAPANTVQQASPPLPAHKHPISSRSTRRRQSNRKQCIGSSAGQLRWRGSVPSSTSKNHIAIAAEAQPWTLGAPKGKATTRPQQHPQDLSAWVSATWTRGPAALRYSKGTTNTATGKAASSGAQPRLAVSTRTLLSLTSLCSVLKVILSFYGYCFEHAVLTDPQILKGHYLVTELKY